MKKTCPIATNGLEIRSNGKFSPCCVSNRFIKDEQSKHFNINDGASVVDVWNSPDRKKFIEDFDNEFDIYCKNCKDIEDSGGESKRLQEIKNLTPDADHNNLNFLDIKMGNTCNLQCVMCGPAASSKWASTYKTLGLSDVRIEQWQELDSFWEELHNITHHVTRLEISGGEPFLIKKQEKLIKYLVDNNLAKNIDILWITNSTVWPDYLVKYLPHFKISRIMLSLDNTHEQFEYIRHPAKWDDTYEIFLKFKELHDKDEIILGISHSITSLNVMLLPEFIEWCRTHKVPVYNNMVHNFLCIRDMPKEFKEKAAEILASITESSFQTNPIIGEDNWLIQYMMQDGDHDRAKRYYNTVILPTRGREAFEKAFPELTDYF